MQDNPNEFDHPLVGLERPDWLQKVSEIVGDQGQVTKLGAHHSAVLVEEKPTLLVTFETHVSISKLSDVNQPLGWDLVKALGWSHLALISDGNTWFRDPAVYGYFDALIDDGFFDKFDRVVFYGAGSCGYAAAAFSVASPGSTVVAISPQATLDPRVTEWDDRYTHMRKVSFSDRYGYAPDMLDAADQAFIIYDPEFEYEAMHSALFTRPNVTRFRMRHMGPDIQDALMQMQVLYRILAQAGAGKLTEMSLTKLWRARRDANRYLNNLLTRVQDIGSPTRVAYLCSYVLSRGAAPRFRRALNAARDKAQTEGRPFPNVKA